MKNFSSPGQSCPQSLDHSQSEKKLKGGWLPYLYPLRTLRFELPRTAV